MSNTNEEEKVDSYDEGKGKEITPEPESDNTNVNNDTSESKSSSGGDVNITAVRIGGIAALVASIIMFILSMVFSPYIAIGGAVLFLGAVGAMFYSGYEDEKQAEIQNHAYTNKINSNISAPSYEPEEEYSCSKDINNFAKYSLNSQQKEQGI